MKLNQLLLLSKESEVDFRGSRTEASIRHVGEWPCRGLEAGPLLDMLRACLVTEDEERQLLDAECEPSTDQSQEWAALAVPWSLLHEGVVGGVDDGGPTDHQQMLAQGRGGRADDIWLIDSVMPNVPSSSSKQPFHGVGQPQCY